MSWLDEFSVAEIDAIIAPVCNRIMRGSGEEADALQEVWVTVLSKSPPDRDRDAKKAYLAVMAANRCRDLLRRMKSDARKLDRLREQLP